jgi:hypothetical protein
MVILAIPVFIVTRMAQTVVDATDTPLWTRPLIAADSLAFYLWKLIWPANLSVVYGRAPQRAVGEGWVYSTWIAPLLAGVLVWILRRRIPLLTVGAAVMVLGLLPVLGLTRFMFQVHSTVADHYMYIPMLGVAITVAGGVAKLNGRWAIAAGLVMLMVLAVLTSLQLRHWRNNVTLFTQAIRVSPDDSGAQGNLGRALAHAGRLDDAMPHLRKAVILAPQDREERISLAQALLLQGRPAEAAEHARVALDLSLLQAGPGAETVRENFVLGQALERLGDLPAAQQHLSAAARQHPNDPAILAALARVRSTPSQIPATQP